MDVPESTEVASPLETPRQLGSRVSAHLELSREAQEALDLDRRPLAPRSPPPVRWLPPPTLRAWIHGLREGWRALWREPEPSPEELARETRLAAEREAFYAGPARDRWAAHLGVPGLFPLGVARGRRADRERGLSVYGRLWLGAMVFGSGGAWLAGLDPWAVLALLLLLGSFVGFVFAGTPLASLTGRYLNARRDRELLIRTGREERSAGQVAVTNGTDGGLSDASSEAHEDPPSS